VATLQTDTPKPSLQIAPAHWVAVGLVTAALGWSYAPNFAYLVDHWEHDPNYSYGYFVIPIALVILWARRGMFDRSQLAPPRWGLLPLLVLLALRYPLFERNELFAETAMLPLVVGALLLAAGGWHLVRVTWPSVLFLLFMLPVPPSYNPMLAAPLQEVATRGSLNLMQIIGLPVVAEGNVLWVGSHPLEVARACNGLSMLLSFVTLITAVVILMRMPLWERVMLLVSAIPIALLSNILRIAATGVVSYYVGMKWAEKLQTHEVAGWLMMPMALLMVWLELKLWSWLFIEVEEMKMSTARRLQHRHRRPAH
jgi:exosortase